MAENKAKPGRKKDRSKQAGQRLTRSERRFAPERAGVTVWTIAGTVLGGLAVGVGVYGRWIAREPMPYAWMAVVGGAVVLAAVVLWGDLVGQVVRVGDAGVGVEPSGKPMWRIAWCDVAGVALRDGVVRVQGEGGEIAVPVKSNPKAAAWVVREAEARMPKVVKLSEGERQALPSTSEGDGEKVVVERVQLTGRACKATGTVITFERDVWLCERCGQLYHKDSVPERCLTCDAEMAPPAG